MTYSANFYAGPDYAVGYAIADHPLGPYAKAAENPILERSAQITGPGHSCMFHAPDGQLMICYHGYTEKSSTNRVGFISPAHITAEGRLVIDRD